MSNTDCKNKFLYKEISFNDENGNEKVIYKKRGILKALGVIAVIALFLICFLFVINAKPFKVKIGQINTILSQLFVPSKYSTKTYDGYFEFLFNTAIPKIWDTVKMVYISTIIGSLIAVPLYILAARNVVEKKRIYMPVRLILNFFRTIPTFVLALIGTIFFGFNETAGIFAMSMFTTGVIFKLMYEYVETVDMNPAEAIVSSGANKLEEYRIAIHPQVMPMFISNVIYIFEINIRASVILGFVGAGGIGQLLSDAIEIPAYDKIGAILIPLFILVVFLQLLSSFIRRKVK